MWDLQLRTAKTKTTMPTGGPDHSHSHSQQSAYGVGTGSGMCMLVCMYVAVWQVKILGDLFGEEGALLCRSLFVEEQVQAVAFRPCAYAATIYMREGEAAGSKLPSRIHARAPRGQAVWFDD